MWKDNHVLNFIYQRWKLSFKLNFWKVMLLLFVISQVWVFGIMFVASSFSTLFITHYPLELELDQFETTDQYLDYIEQQYPERLYLAEGFTWITMIGVFTIPFFIILLLSNWKWLWKKEFRRENW